MSSSFRECFKKHAVSTSTTGDLYAAFFDGKIFYYILSRCRFVFYIQFILFISNFARYRFIYDHFPIYSLASVYFWIQMLNLAESFLGFYGIPALSREG